MTARISINDLTSDDLDRLHARAERAEALLCATQAYLAATHVYADRHDLLGEGYGCAGCALHTDLVQHRTWLHDQLAPDAARKDTP